MTTWYRVGLVNLTNGSDMVAGVGTEWSGRVLPGGIFFAPTELIEVERVLADGSLKLVTPYAGPSLAGVPYAIAPTQGYVVEQSRLLGEVLTNFGDLLNAWLAGDLKGDPAESTQQAIAAAAAAQDFAEAAAAVLAQVQDIGGNDYGSISEPVVANLDYGLITEPAA